MYCRAFALDFDGTSAAGGRLDPDLAAALAAARFRGFSTLLASGRVLEELREGGVDGTLFDAVVAENGALVWLPGVGRTVQLGTPPPEHFLGELRAAGIPHHAGAVVVGTWDRHAAAVLGIIRRLGLDAYLVFNRAAVMVLPSGIDKAVGVRRALAELRRSERNLIAFGDSENDHALLAVAEVGVAARGSLPAIVAAADDRIAQPGGAGVGQYVRGVVERDGHVPTPSRHRVEIGTDPAGGAVTLPASGINVMVSGDPRAGKSWLAGLLAERLVERGYRLCVLDSEGDHLPLGERPQILTLGGDLALPAPSAVPHLLHYQSLSVVLNLAALGQAAKVRWVEQALAALETARLATGIPHWILVEEAHYYLHEGARSATVLDGETGNFILVTYRPSVVASRVHARVRAHLLTRTAVEEERYFVTGLLQARGPRDLHPAAALAALGPAAFGLLLEDRDTARWQVFAPADRLTAHAHHGRKYAEAMLPGDKAFWFQHAERARLQVARNVAEFYAAVQEVPIASLRHHLAAGDFSRWAGDVLGDAQLAAGFRKLEADARAGAEPSREEILDHVNDRYLV